MPTVAQEQELLDGRYTTSEWTTQGGKNGRRVTSLINGNSIFLPAAGDYLSTMYFDENEEGQYWTRSINPSANFHAYAMILTVDYLSTKDDSRQYGKSIRAVRKQ